MPAAVERCRVGVARRTGGAMITTRSEIFALDGNDDREKVATTTSSILVRGEGQ